MRKIILPVSAAVVLLGGLSFAGGGVSVGTITYTEGVVDIMPQGEDIRLANEEYPVSIGDRIRTKRYSKAEITFADKSIVRLAPGSCIFVDKYLLDGARRHQADIRLTRGKLEAVVSRTGRPETFVITTPNAAGRVKGSDIFVFYQAGKTGALIKKGLMSLSNISLPVEIVDLRRGDYSLVSFEEAPIEPRPYFDAELARHEKDIAPAVVKKWIPSGDAAVMTGRATAIDGEVRIFKKGADDWRIIETDETILEGDKIQTAESATLEICFANGNSLFLKENTELTVAILKYDPSTGEYDNTFDSGKGRIKAVIASLGRKSTFQVRTPNATCGVVGTVMYLDIQQNQTQAFYEGGGGIVNSPISGDSEIMNAGTNTMIDDRGVIAAPAPTLGDQRLYLEESWGGPDLMGGYSLPMGAVIPEGDNIFGPVKDADSPPITTGPDKGGPGMIMDGSFVPPPPFDENFPPPPLPPPTGLLYDAALTINTPSSSAWIGIPGLGHIDIKNDNTWQASFQGNIDSTPMYPWNIVYDNLHNDEMDISGASPWAGGTWSSDVNGVAGVINGTPINKIFSGDAQGTYTYNATEGNGTFQGTASGTWENAGGLEP